MPILLLTLLACAESEAPPAPVEAPPAPVEAPPAEAPPAPQPATTSTTPAAASGTSTGSLPDLSQGLPSGMCGNGPGKEGADSHFVGTFTINGQAVSGKERWLLAANQHLQASKLWNAGASCEVVWGVRGEVVPVGACSSCDLGLRLTATVDMGASTCPEDMVKREKSFEVLYDVRRDPDGVAWFHFGKSGKALGQGYHQGNSLTFLTQHQCKWF